MTTPTRPPRIRDLRKAMSVGPRAPTPSPQDSQDLSHGTDVKPVEPDRDQSVDETKPKIIPRAWRPIQALVKLSIDSGMDDQSPRYWPFPCPARPPPILVKTPATGSTEDPHVRASGLYACGKTTDELPVKHSEISEERLRLPMDTPQPTPTGRSDRPPMTKTEAVDDMQSETNEEGARPPLPPARGATPPQSPSSLSRPLPQVDLADRSPSERTIGLEIRCSRPPRPPPPALWNNKSSSVRSASQRPPRPPPPAEKRLIHDEKSQRERDPEQRKNSFRPPRPPPPTVKKGHDRRQITCDDRRHTLQPVPSPLRAANDTLGKARAKSEKLLPKTGRSLPDGFQLPPPPRFNPPPTPVASGQRLSSNVCSSESFYCEIDEPLYLEILPAINSNQLNAPDCVLEPCCRTSNMPAQSGDCYQSNGTPFNPHITEKAEV